jgi:hypothetical protein
LYPRINYFAIKGATLTDRGTFLTDHKSATALFYPFECNYLKLTEPFS